MPDLISFLEKRLGASLRIEERNSSKREPASLPAELHAQLTEELAVDIALHERVMRGGFTQITRPNSGAKQALTAFWRQPVSATGRPEARLRAGLPCFSTVDL